MGAFPGLFGDLLRELTHHGKLVTDRPVGYGVQYNQDHIFHKVLLRGARSVDAKRWRIALGQLDEKMGVEVLEQSPDRVVATMPVEGNRQSLGLLHGGAMVALAEAVGSWAALIHASESGKVAVGVDINATHHASGRSGLVTATATAIRLGRTIASHEVVITDESGQRLCTARITNALVERGD